jgi:oxygen-independent coproporphyrinogen-3 oxidase
LCHAVVEREEIDRCKAAGEFMFLGLRMVEGVSIKKYRARFGQAPAEMHPRIGVWIAEDLMEEKRGYLRLTAKGLMLANSIFVEFM